jgi:hypothetical protein
MILPRTTTCNVIEIRAPRWKQRVVGVASFRVGHHNAIDIIATGKDGKRYYPDTLYGSGEMIRKCETQHLPSGVILYLVPISQLEPLERENEQPKIIKEQQHETITQTNPEPQSLFGNTEQFIKPARRPNGYDVDRQVAGRH